jgi:hypothetical protein
LAAAVAGGPVQLKRAGSMPIMVGRSLWRGSRECCAFTVFMVVVMLVLVAEWRYLWRREFVRRVHYSLCSCQLSVTTELAPNSVTKIVVFQMYIRVVNYASRPIELYEAPTDEQIADAPVLVVGPGECRPLCCKITYNIVAWCVAF